MNTQSQQHVATPARTHHSRLTAVGRSGFSLIELLLVLGLLMIVFATALPSMQRAIGQGPLQTWAQDTRAAANVARISAIDTGQVYQLRYEVDGTQCVAIPNQLDTESLAGEQTGDAESDGGTVPKASFSMVEELSFRGVAGESVTTEKLEREWFGEMQDASSLADANWSPAIRFYPDGTADEAVFEIVDKRKQAISISIRDLTGAVTISPVFSTEDER